MTGGSGPVATHHASERDGSARAELYARLPLTDTDTRWLELARVARPRRVLELGAGAGRLSAALATADVEVVAVERDPVMLARLRQRAGSRVTVVEADVTALPDLGRFGLVLLQASLLNELPDVTSRRAALAGAAKACHRDGSVALQLLDPQWLAQLPPHAIGRLVPLAGGEPVEVQVEDRGLDPSGGRRRATLRYRFADGSRYADHLDAAVITRAELEGLLTAAGLHVREAWGARPGGAPPRAGDAAWHVVAGHAHKRVEPEP